MSNDSNSEIFVEDDGQSMMSNPCEFKNPQLFTNFCGRIIDISQRVPLEVALPLYGYLLPFVILVTVITNSFIVIVLSQRHLRTPTNAILLAMAITELLTGLCSFPWLLYYYTFQGYKADQVEGLPEFWCKHFQLLTETLPTLFHTGAIWLTVFLAVQRYIYVCVPSVVRDWCTTSKTKLVIIVLVTLPLLIEVPKALSSFNEVHLLQEPDGTRYVKQFCVFHHSDWVLQFGIDAFYSAYYCIMAVLIHGAPCLLLSVLSGFLICAIQKADRHRRNSLLPQGCSQRSSSSNRAGSATSNSLKSFHATTKMLVVVIALFLVIEIPAAVIFVTHIYTVTFSESDDYYGLINVALILRNVLILVSYPFNFAIYCGMSTQFRMTVMQLFSKQPMDSIIVPQSLMRTTATGAQISNGYLGLHSFEGGTCRRYSNQTSTIGHVEGANSSLVHSNSPQRQNTAPISKHSGDHSPLL